MENSNTSIVDKLNKRIDELQSELNYYKSAPSSTTSNRFAVTFSDEAHSYYKTIPTRLLEIEYILKNII